MNKRESRHRARQARLQAEGRATLAEARITDKATERLQKQADKYLVLAEDSRARAGRLYDKIAGLRIDYERAKKQAEKAGGGR